MEETFIFHNVGHWWRSLTFWNQSTDLQSKSVLLYFPSFKVYKSQTRKNEDFSSQNVLITLSQISEV